MRIFLASILIILIPFGCLATRTLSITQLISEIQSSGTEDFELKDAVITLDMRSDLRFVPWLFHQDTIVINKNVLLSRVIFPQISFQLFDVRQNLVLDNITGTGEINWSRTKFNQVHFINSKLEGGLSFIECSFHKVLDFSGTQITGNLSIWESSFENMGLFIYQQSQMNTCRLHIEKCSFNSWEQGINLCDSHFDEIKIRNSFVLSDVLLSGTIAENKLEMRNNQIGQHFVMTNANYPMGNTIVEWPQIEGKLAGLYDELYHTGAIYLPDSDSALADTSTFEDLQAVYYNLYSIYKQRGNTESANKCYIALKNLETRLLDYKYRMVPGMQAFFNLKMNQFLKFFCDYGTNPVKSIIYAFNIILMFSGLYFFLPSEPDNLSRHRVHRLFSRIRRYCSTDINLSHIHQEQHSRVLNQLNSFREEVIQNSSNAPKVLALVGKPIYLQNVAYYRLSGWLLHKFDFLQGTWNDLPRKKKWILGSMISLYILVYLLGGVFMRALNALTLSVNAFITLGYGEIEAKGIPRYLAVAQGAIGWFLLSIFSVSLISQILQ